MSTTDRDVTLPNFTMTENEVNGIDMPDGRNNNTTKKQKRPGKAKAGKKEIELLTEYESSSQGILEAVGLQQTLNIAVVFVKADLVVNFLYHITSAFIVASIVAQALLAIIVGAKIWTRKNVKRLKNSREELMIMENNDEIDDKILMKQNRLRLLDLMSLFLTIIITFLTTVLLATSGMVESRVKDEAAGDISPTGASVN